MNLAYRLVGVGLWLLFLLIVPRRQWRALYPTLLFTALLAIVADLLGVVYGQWEYIGPTTGGLSLWSDLGFAPPTRGLAVYISKRYPVDLVELVLWIGANGLGEMALCTVGLNPLPPMDDFQSQPFLYPLFCPDLSSGTVVAARRLI